MVQVIQALLILVIAVAFAAAVRYGVEYGRKVWKEAQPLVQRLTTWLDAHTTAQERQEMRDAVRTLVARVEQVVTGPDGQRRFAWVLSQAQRLFPGVPIVLIEAAIQEAYNELRATGTLNRPDPPVPVAPPAPQTPPAPPAPPLPGSGG